MRSTVVRTLKELADEGVDLHLLTADLGFKVLDPFREAHPARFTNVGVSEANMIGVAAGLALAGKRPVCYSMVPFLFMRAFEQVRLDLVVAHLPVLLVGVGGGLSYGHEGPSHHAIEDLAMARALPGLRIIAPGDPKETVAAVRWAMSEQGPTFLRLGKNGDPIVHASDVNVRHPLTLTNPDAPHVVIATGHILAETIKAAEVASATLRRPLRVVSMPTLKPLDETWIRQLARDAQAIFTVEEHGEVGGLGSAVAEVLFSVGYRRVFRKIALASEYCTTHGSHDWLRKQFGLDAGGIARQLVECLPLEDPCPELHRPS